MNKLVLFGLIFFFGMSRAGAEEGLSLDDLLKSLEEQHPALRSLQLNQEGALEYSRSVGNLPDPVVKFGLFPGQVVTRNGPMKSKLGVVQVLPPRARRRFQREIEVQESDVLQTQMQVLKFSLVRALKESFFDYVYLRDQITLVQENLALSRQWESLFQTHYSFHDYLYPSLMLLQVENIKLEDQLKSLKNKRAVISQRLRSLAWMEGIEPLPWPGWTQDFVEVDKVQAADFEANAQLLLLDAKIKKAGGKINLARSFKKPGYQLGAEWTEIGSKGFGAEPGQDAWTLFLGVNLPVYRRSYESRIMAQTLKRQALVEKRQALQGDLEASHEKLSYDLEEALRQYLLYKTELIPRTEEALKSLQASYKTGSSDFFAVLDNLKLSLQLHLALENHKRSFWKALAGLEEVLGEPLH